MTEPANVEDRPLIVSVNLTTACNLACTYCHAIHRRESIDDACVTRVAEGVGRLTGEPVQIVPFGGEPLVAWPRLRALVEQSEGHGVRRFMLCTNGLLLDRPKLEYFMDHDVEVTLSWDGVAPAQDALRVYADGRGTSDEIERVFDMIRGVCREPLHMRITVSPDTAAHFGDSVAYVFDRLGDRPGVKLCFMPVSTAPWSEVQLASLRSGLRTAAEALVRHRRAGHSVAFAYNECLRAHELGEQILFSDEPHGHACLWGVKMLGVDTDGGVYPCHTMIELRREQREHLCMGNVADGVPDLRRRLELMPPPEGNPYHACFAWNLVNSGDPFEVPEVYRFLYRAFLEESLRVVEQLVPAQLALAERRAAELLARAARWDEELRGRPRPSVVNPLGPAVR